MFEFIAGAMTVFFQAARRDNNQISPICEIDMDRRTKHIFREKIGMHIAIDKGFHCQWRYKFPGRISHNNFNFSPSLYPSPGQFRRFVGSNSTGNTQNYFFIF